MIDHRNTYGAVLAVGLVVGVVGAGTTPARAGDRISDAKVVRWVDKTVAERQATADDKRFDEIGWVTDIRTAIRLGKENNRPTFLYIGDGRINTGRC